MKFVSWNVNGLRACMGTQGDRKTPLALEPCDAEIAALEARTLAALKPTRPRTAENFVNLMKELSK